jgi:hypothetical protein
MYGWGDRWTGVARFHDRFRPDVWVVADQRDRCSRLIARIQNAHLVGDNDNPSAARQHHALEQRIRRRGDGARRNRDPVRFPDANGIKFVDVVDDAPAKEYWRECGEQQLRIVNVCDRRLFAEHDPNCAEIERDAPPPRAAASERNHPDALQRLASSVRIWSRQLYSISVLSQWRYLAMKDANVTWLVYSRHMQREDRWARPQGGIRVRPL